MVSMKAEDLNDDGVLNLVRELVLESKKKLIFSYIHLERLKRLGPSQGTKWEIREAYERFTKSKEFFHSELFDCICPMDPDDYIQSLLRDSKKLYKRYKEGTKC